MKKVVWNKVTPFSQLIAVLLALVILVIGIQIGREYQSVLDIQAAAQQ
jgi:hypothetical protein